MKRDGRTVRLLIFPYNLRRAFWKDVGFFLFVFFSPRTECAYHSGYSPCWLCPDAVASVFMDRKLSLTCVCVCVCVFGLALFLFSPSPFRFFFYFPSPLFCRFCLSLFLCITAQQLGLLSRACLLYILVNMLLFMTACSSPSDDCIIHTCNHLSLSQDRGR